MANIIFTSKAQLLEGAGVKLGVTDWIPLEQSRIDMFAEATGDHQWIHVDPVKAATGPFGGCISHGYLTLSLVNFFYLSWWTCKISAWVLTTAAIKYVFLAW
jgi:acyl dehydratase